MLVDMRIVNSWTLAAVADYNLEQNSSGAQQKQYNLAEDSLGVLPVSVKTLAVAVGIDWETDWSQKYPEVAPVHGNLGEEDTG